MSASPCRRARSSAASGRTDRARRRTSKLGQLLDHVVHLRARLVHASLFHQLGAVANELEEMVLGARLKRVPMVGRATSRFLPEGLLHVDGHRERGYSLRSCRFKATAETESARQLGHVEGLPGVQRRQLHRIQDVAQYVRACSSRTTPA
jgi:hypothetical protein